jgi:Tol biopolymer transport system component
MRTSQPTTANASNGSLSRCLSRALYGVDGRAGLDGRAGRPAAVGGAGSGRQRYARQRVARVAIAFAAGATLMAQPGPSSAISGPAELEVGRRESTAAPVLNGSVEMIAYAAASSRHRQRSEIYTIHTDGSHRRQLTTAGGGDPAWSPDGMQLAFVGPDGIWLMDASGGSQRLVAAGSEPAWSPDGKRLSYACRDGEDLCVVDLQTGSSTVIVAATTSWPRVRSSTWSPDGTWIAFTRESADGDDYTNYRALFRVHPDGAGLIEIPDTYPEADLPAWSPDGGTILYTERYDGRGGEFSGDLFSIRPDGTAKTQLTDRIGRDQAGAWSPDGQRIALESEAGLYPDQAGIWTMAPNGTSRALVARNGRQPSWRPHFATAAPPPQPAASSTGPRISYVAATDAGHDLFTVRPDGTGTRRLTSSGGVREPVWSPDHKEIAYSSPARSGRILLRVMNVRTGESRRVARTDLYAGGPAWSPDGRRLAWGAFREVVVLHLGTGERYEIPMTSDGECCARDLAWSPNGRLIAFSEELRGITDVMIVPAKGGRSRRVTRLPGAERQLDWSPNGRRILFTRLPGPSWDRAADVWSIKPDGAGLRSVMTTRELDLTPAWSPNGRRLALYSDGPRAFGPSPAPGLWTVGAGGGTPELVVHDRTIAYVDW